MSKSEEMILKDTVTFTIFISSPSDASDERESVSEVIDYLNQYLINKGIGLQPIKWEMSCYPQSGHPQNIINRVLNSSDLCITILKKEFGTPTTNYGSGTEEETMHFLNTNKDVMLYVYKNNSHHDEQSDIKVFITKIRDRILYWEYKDTNDLKFKLYHHLLLRFSGEDTNQLQQRRSVGQKDKFFLQFKPKSILSIIKSQRIISLSDNGYLDFTIQFAKEIEANMLVITGYPIMPDYKIINHIGGKQYIRIKFEDPCPDIITITSPQE